MQPATTSAAGNLYITDTANNRVQEVPVASGAQWGQPMTANYVYTVAGSAAGQAGNWGDGGPATSALLTVAENVSLDPEGDMYITDHNNDRLREVVSGTPATIAPATGLTSALYPAPGGITVTQPGGAQVTFYSASGGHCGTAPYTQVAGQYCVLPQDVGASLALSGGTYTFTQQPGTAFTYNSGGQLTSESQASDSGTALNTLSLAYGTPVPGSGNCPTTATSCYTITAASGRTLVVGLTPDANGNNLVSSVTGQTGRRWAYGYTGDDLTSVTDPTGTHVTSYAYDTGNASPLLVNDILTITKPNGQATGADTVIAYDGSGRVTSVTDPMKFQTIYTWTGYNPSTGSGTITVNDPDGNKTVYYYVQGTLAAQSEWTAATLASEQDFVPDQTVTSGDDSAGTQLVTARADGNGNITTTSYDPAGNVATRIAPDGISGPPAQTTQQSTSLNQSSCSQAVIASGTCSPSLAPLPVPPGGVISPPSSVPPQGVTLTQYDHDGNELWTTTGVYEPGSNTAAYSRTTYQLFKGNSITLNGSNITCAATPPSPTLPCATINADGVITQLAYYTSQDGNGDYPGDLKSTSTPDGNLGNQQATTTYSYDADGEQTSVTSPDGNLTGANAGNYTTVTAYNADGQKTSVTQAGGSGATVTPRQTVYGYDGDGNQVTVKDARTNTSTTTFNADDQPTLVQDPDSNQALTCYDGDGHVAQTVPPVGVAANTLTASSCPTAYPSGYTTRLASDATTYTFNALGQRTEMDTPLPAGQTGNPAYETSTYAYDANGNLIQTTAPPTTNGGPNQATTDTYTATGQLASVTTGSASNPLATISYCYDPNGDQTAVVYGDGNTPGTPTPCETSSPWVVNATSYPTAASYQTKYSYDSAGELVSTTTPATAATPSGATTADTYDPTGNTLTNTDPNGVTTTWTYTPLNLTSTVSYSGGSAHSVSYGYDAAGNKTSMSDATGSSSYQYDPFGELTSAVNGVNQIVGYGYNPDGRVSSITYPLPTGATWAATSTVNYTYDNADLLTKVTDFNNKAITITPTADGFPKSAALGSTGDTISTTYDNTDKPSVITLKNSTTTLQSFTYSDAPAGTTLNEADTPSSSQSPATYNYDSKGRVTSMTPGSGPALSYTYDASSNLTTLPNGASVVNGYDDAGELTASTLSGTTTTYTYNPDGQRLTAKQGSTTVASGTWNGAGQLTAYTDPAMSMTAATYNGDGQRVTAVTSSGTQNFVWNTVSGLPQMIMDSNNAYIYTAGLAPAEQVNLSTGAVTYLTSDKIGSVRGTVNGTGALTGTTGYDAWGSPETMGGLTATTPFGYAAGYTDPTGLIYLINRYYEPSTGQFISLDPALSDTQQPYSYANSNPVTNVDPSGEVYGPGGGSIPVIWCGVHFKQYLVHGIFTLDYGCWISPPVIWWSYRLYPWVQDITWGTVTEHGLLYQINYGRYGKNSPHVEPAWYMFHGTIPKVYNRNIVDMTDEYVIPTDYFDIVAYYDGLFEARV